MKYLGGKIALTQLYTSGMFRIGKMKPERRTVGSIIPTSEMNIACCIVDETVEIRIPSERLIRIYSILSARSSIMLPLTGSLKTHHESSRITMTLINDRIK
jgi:hypothetical protein